MTRAIVIRWQSAYDSLYGLASHYIAVWRALGVEIVEVDCSIDGWQTKLFHAITQREVRFAVCLSGIGLNITEEQQNIWQYRRVPVVGLHFDHPAYCRELHSDLPTNISFAYIFAEHARFSREHVRPPNLVTTLHYGTPDLASPIPPSMQGDPRVVFPKSGGDPAALEEIWRRVPLAGPILRDLADEVGVGNCPTFLPAAIRVAAAHGVELEPYGKLGRFLVAQIDDYVRRRKSTMIARALLPFPVDIYGRGWDHVMGNGVGRARFHGPVAFDVVESAIAAAAATVTMNPNVDSTAHDRFFLSLGAGKLPISDANGFTVENFPALADYGFSFTPEAIASALDRFYTKPREAIDLAASLKIDARRRFPIEASAHKVLDTAQATEFFEHRFVAPQDFFHL